MIHCISLVLSFLLAHVTTSNFCADPDLEEQKYSDAASFVMASYSAFFNDPTPVMALHEAAALPKEKHATFADFKKACAKNELSTIQTMLTEKLITSAEAGMAVWNLGDTINAESMKAIADTYPYAVWDAQESLLNPYPAFAEEYIKKSLENGFMLPYQRTEKAEKITYLPILNYFVVRRYVIQEEPTRIVGEPDYEMIERLLQVGANPYFKGYCWFLDRKDVDTYCLQQYLKKSEEGQKIKALLDKYAQPANEKGEFNTTDMFYPGTRFYRKAEEKSTKKE